MLGDTALELGKHKCPLTLVTVLHQKTSDKLRFLELLLLNHAARRKKKRWTGIGAPEQGFVRFAPSSTTGTKQVGHFTRRAAQDREDRSAERDESAGIMSYLPPLPELPHSMLIHTHLVC